VNKRKLTHSEIKNLLESSGFSPKSGYYIVRQGNVNKLTLVKDSDRLKLIKDLS
jgi:structural maintenance of chromosome 3 (chondroitin sulfate proteoglycan 6)